MSKIEDDDDMLEEYDFSAGIRGKSAQAFDIRNLVEQFVDLEKQRYPITAAYLFGSWAIGNQHEESDIDVGLIIDKEVSPEMETQIFADAQSLNFRLEPHVFSQKYFVTARRNIVYEMKTKGIRLA